MTIFDKKQIANSLEKLAKRIDSTLDTNHLQLTIYDVKFLNSLAKAIKENLFTIYELKGINDNYIWRE